MPVMFFYYCRRGRPFAYVACSCSNNKTFFIRVAEILQVCRAHNLQLSCYFVLFCDENSAADKTESEPMSADMSLSEQQTAAVVGSSSHEAE